jgi:hypothetical protein
MAPTWIWQQPDWPLGTAAIKGEQLDPGQVRSSIARRFGLALADGQPQASAQVEGLLDVLLAATGELHQALTLATLHQWHRRLFADGPDGLRAIRIGELRGNAPMQVLSGPIGASGSTSRHLLERIWRPSLRNFWPGSLSHPPILMACGAPPWCTSGFRSLQPQDRHHQLLLGR